MKEALAREVLQQMLPYVNNEQAMRLQKIMEFVLINYEVTSTQGL